MTTTTTEPQAKPRLLALESIAAEFLADNADAHEAYRNNQPRGPRIALPRLSAAVGNTFPLGLGFVHGEPGAGKTAFVLQLAAEAGCPTLFVSAEMAALELFRRLVARSRGIFLGQLRSGELTPENALQLARDTVRDTPHLAILDSTTGWADPAFIRDSALSIRGNHRHLLIVVDSLHSWAEGAPNGGTEYDLLNGTIATLRGLSAALSCPVLVVAERNRLSMKKGGLSASKGTSRIEYSAELVMALSRDEQCEDGRALLNGETPVVLTLDKNRNGPPGQPLNLLFHGAKQQFREP